MLLLAVFGLVLVVAVLVLAWRQWCLTHPASRPKGFIDKNFVPLESSTRDATREIFREKKLPADPDYVIVGSGIGSLYCAGLLARAGKKVVVLEQHYVAGGCTHSWHDKGFEFDTGLHYVGRIEKYKQLLDLVSGEKKVEWAKMGTAEDGFCYDEIKLGADKPFKFPAGEQEFTEALIKEFPEEADAIREYVRLCKRVNKKADMYFYGKLFARPIQWLINKLLNTEYFTWASKSTWDVVSGLTQNKRLRALLCGQFGDYGLKPQDSSFLIQAGICAHYLDAAYYPIGGSQEISRAIIPTIERAGGKVLVRARVTSVAIENGRAVGVHVATVNSSGEADPSSAVLVKAKYGVISGAGARATNSIVPDEHRAKLGYDAMLSEVKPSISHVYGFVGMTGTTEELGLRAANLWVLPVDDEYNYEGLALDDTDKALESSNNPWADVGNDDDKDDMLLFMGFPSVKDPSFASRCPGKSTCEIISTAHSEWFEAFLSEKVSGTRGNPNQSGKRTSEDYALIKKGLEEKLLRALYRHYPKTRGKVEYVNIGTPLTNVYYLNRPDSYGLEHTPAHYSGALDLMRPQTGIPGLYATGQDIGTVGVVGALNGGILTAHAVLGYGFWDLVCIKRNLIEDIMAMDKKEKEKKA